MTSQVDTNAYTTHLLDTAKVHRHPYPAISPLKPDNSQKGKIVIVTGGGAGIGAVSFSKSFNLQLQAKLRRPQQKFGLVLGLLELSLPLVAQRILKPLHKN